MKLSSWIRNWVHHPFTSNWGHSPLTNKVNSVLKIRVILQFRKQNWGPLPFTNISGRHPFVENLRLSSFLPAWVDSSLFEWVQMVELETFPGGGGLVAGSSKNKAKSLFRFYFLQHFPVWPTFHCFSMLQLYYIDFTSEKLHICFCESLEYWKH